MSKPDCIIWDISPKYKKYYSCRALFACMAIAFLSIQLRQRKVLVVFPQLRDTTFLILSAGRRALQLGHTLRAWEITVI